MNTTCLLPGAPLQRPMARARPAGPRTPRLQALSKAAGPAAPRKGEEAESSAGLSAWLPWSRNVSSSVAEDLQEPAQPSGRSFLPQLWSSAAAAEPQQPPPQQQPAPKIVRSKTGTQDIRKPALVSAAVVAQPAAPSGGFVPYWRPAAPAAAEPEPAVRPISSPVISCAGGGIFFFWEMGVMKYLLTHFDLSKVTMIGASAGGLASTLTACGVDPDKAVREAYRLSIEADIWNRPGGLAGIWGPLVREWLDELLPEDAVERCNGRVKLVATELPLLQLRYIDSFSSRDDLIDANMASVHIPFLLDGRGTYSFRGRQYMDGSLYDFIFGNNSQLLTLNGDALVVDYFNDTELKYSRLDFVKLADFDYVAELERCGYAYAERLDAAGGLEYWLGPFRKGLVRRAVEYPVRQVRRVLTSMDLV